MMKISRYAAWTLVALGIFCSASEAKSKYTTFQIPGATITQPVSINAEGDITGQWEDAQVLFHGFIRTADGTMTSFDVQGASVTCPTSISRSGVIAGFALINETEYGFIRTPDGAITTFQSPDGDVLTDANAMNDAGVITGEAFHGSRKHGHEVGYLRAPSGDFTLLGKNIYPSAISSTGMITGFLVDHKLDGYHAFVRTPDGILSSFDPGEAGAFAYGANINTDGTIVGSYATVINGEVFEAFIRASSGTTTTFRIPGDDVTSTYATAINRRGLIGGTYSKTDNSDHGYVRATDGKITNIDPPNATSTQIIGINDRGQIIGSFRTSDNGPLMGFLKKP